MILASLRGRQAEAAPLIEGTIAEATAGGQGIAVAYAHWAAAILANGLGHYADALAAAREASEDTATLYISMWALPELIEAAARTGDTGLAGDALTRLAEFTLAAGTDFGLGVEARSRALLSAGETAGNLYREAIERLGRTRLRPELARAHLLYGEWLRRENRRTEARDQLRTAHDMLAVMGAEAFAERVRRELLATGESVRQRTAGPASPLTAQEAHIARLAADGHSNPEIAAQLFLSARTWMPAVLHRDGGAALPWPLTCALGLSVGAGPRAVSPGLRTRYGLRMSGPRWLEVTGGAPGRLPLDSVGPLDANYWRRPLAELGDRASRTSGSGIRTVDVLSAGGEH
jgi:hypothetical protein